MRPFPGGFSGALDFAKRRYRSYPNVLGVAGGFKFRRGRRTEDLAVQFFVRKKLHEPPRRLPRFVFGRDRRGELLRSVRIPTDVIASRPPHFACGAGGKIRARGGKGSITLLFLDKSSSKGNEKSEAFYLITCAHVFGNLQRSPPLSPELRMDRKPRQNPFAVVIKNTVARGRVVEFDAALAQVRPAALPVPDLVLDGGGRLRGLLDPEALEPGMELEVSCSSGRRWGDLVSLSGEMAVRLNGRPFRVQNLYGMKAGVRRGDSGGLVHDRGMAIGMLVARSPGGLSWWQPLKPALAILNRLLPRTRVRPF